MVHYDPLQLPHAELKRRVVPMVAGMDATERPGRTWRLPVCYHDSCGPDLADVAVRTGLSVAQVVERHSAATYHVYMVGFLPGYPYMGGLPPELELPRRENPRIKVPSGSVAIAMAMTAIYTLESPGGWHLLGRTPAPIWDVRRTPPALLTAGDQLLTIVNPEQREVLAVLRATMLKAEAFHGVRGDAAQLVRMLLA